VGGLLLVVVVSGELLRGARARGLLRRLRGRVPGRRRRDPAATAALTQGDR
jgi:hypothetical protein